VPEPDPEVRARIREMYEAPDGYVLHFSSHNDRRDNTDTVLAAFSRALTSLGAGKRLVIAGDLGRERSVIEKEAARLRIRDRLVMPGYLADTRLVQAYQAADVYLDPSLYEGFGLQVIEAMACGVPVVCSNTTSLPELVGDAALMAAPHDAETFADLLIRICSDCTLNAELRRRAILRSASYSWVAAARQITALYDEVLR
jgi:glycosyltransferase involved in cell wall biosynthesis